MKTIAIAALGMVWLSTFAVLAKDSPFKEALVRVPKAELPAKAAVLIKDTKAAGRATVTLQVVQTSVELNPAATPVVVSAISRAVPDMAAIAAGAAAAQQPKQASAIAKAAAAAAPSMAGKIVVAVCRAAPNDYRKIAVAAAQVVPGAAKEILDAVAVALPELKAGIERVLAGYGGNPPSVAFVLDPRTQSADSDPTTPGPAPTPLARGPIVGPPFLPLTQTPTNVTPGTSGNVPPGGPRPVDYAEP